RCPSADTPGCRCRRTWPGRGPRRRHGHRCERRPRPRRDRRPSRHRTGGSHVGLRPGLPGLPVDRVAAVEAAVLLHRQALTVVELVLHGDVVAPLAHLALEGDLDPLLAFRHFSNPYLMILMTRPAPTVRPPSRMAKRRPSCIAMGLPSST